MTFLLLIPVLLSLLLLAAHFLHNYEITLMLASLVAAFLLLFPRRWSALALQIFLLTAAVEWVRTIFVLLPQYESRGKSPRVMVIILVSVAAFTAASTLVFFTPRLRQRYNGQVRLEA